MKLSKDIYAIIAYQISPKNGHTSRDWGSFVRINRVTAQIGREQKHDRAKMFGISLDMYQFQKSVNKIRDIEQERLQKLADQTLKRFENYFNRLKTKWKLSRWLIDKVVSDSDRMRYYFLNTYVIGPQFNEWVNEKTWEITGRNPNCQVGTVKIGYKLIIYIVNVHSCKLHLMRKLERSGTYLRIQFVSVYIYNIYKEISREFIEFYDVGYDEYDWALSFKLKQ